MAATDRLLTSQEVQDRLRISRQTLWRWVQDGRLVAQRAGRRLLFTEDALAAALQMSQPSAEYVVSRGTPPVYGAGSWFMLMGPTEEAAVAHSLSEALSLAGAPADPSVLADIVGGRTPADPVFWRFLGRGLERLLARPEPEPSPEVAAHVDAWMAGDRSTNLWDSPEGNTPATPDAAVEPTPSIPAAAPDAKRSRRRDRSS